MANEIKKEQEELFRTIYKIATDLVHAGHVAEWDFKSYVLGSGGQPLRPDGINMTPHAALNYLIITVPAAVLLAVAAAFFSKNVSVKIEENGENGNENN